MSLMTECLAAWRDYKPEALQAEALLNSWGDFPRVPGMDTALRLAHRLAFGRSVEEAAAREYVYRWNLALRSPIFGVPHTIGM